MSYKILTKNGIDNTNIDGARGEHFNAGMRDGIVKGALNEGTFGTNASNSIFLDSCELRISGHRIVINEPVYKTFENAPLNNVRYSYVAQIIVDDSSNVEFSLLVQSANTKLMQDNLFKTINGKGTYQVEIGRFTLQTDGTITDVVRTIDVITGGGNTKGVLTIGNVSTEKIDYKLNVEVDIDQRYDEEQQKEFLDFKFQLPLDVTEIETNTNTALQKATNSETLSNQANERSQSALTAADSAMNIAEESNLTADSALTVSTAAGETANRAEATADEAKRLAEQAVEGVGTKVTENGNFKPNYEINNITLSQLQDDATHRTVSDDEKTNWNSAPISRGYIEDMDDAHETGIYSYNQATTNKPQGILQWGVLLVLKGYQVDTFPYLTQIVFSNNKDDPIVRRVKYEEGGTEKWSEWTLISCPNNMIYHYATANTDLVAEGLCSWYQIGNSVFVNIIDLKFKTEPPNGATIFSGLPTSIKGVTGIANPLGAGHIPFRFTINPNTNGAIINWWSLATVGTEGEKGYYASFSYLTK